MLVWIPSPTAPPPHPHLHRAASGGGAPCVTAGDTRAKREGTRGQADYSDPDAGGVALKAWRGNSDVQRWTAVRHHRCRRVGLSSVHGFALRASPAVKHGVSPPGTAGEHEGRLRSTQSPHIASSASTSTQSNASGGGAPCVTAGDTRAKRGGTRGGSGQRTLRRRRRRTESVEGITQTCRSGLLCDTAGVGSLCCRLSTGSPFGHHPRLSMGCPRRGQWVNTLCRRGEWMQ